jgi:ferrous iron transport protein B
LQGGRSVIGRLAALGFTPGAPVTLIRKQHHGPLLVNVRGVQIALGQQESQHVLLSLAEQEEIPSEPTSPPAHRTIALAGQPNVGKSTVFNLITGLNQHVGNWTGKTIEQKTGQFTHAGQTYHIVDLPGTYSLTANSEEERLAREYILKEHPDLVIVVVDAATLERNLYLLAEILLLPAPVVLALNMMDVARQEGIQVEPKVLESALGIPVVPMSASHGQGINTLIETAIQLLDGKIAYQPRRPSILPTHQSVLQSLTTQLTSFVPAPYPPEWVALKLLEGDEEITSLMKNHVPAQEWEKIGRLLYQHEDAILDIAGARYEWIARMVRAAIVQPQVTRVGLTAQLDRILTHPLWGTLILIAILGCVFWLTYTIGSPIQGWLSDQVTWLADLLRVPLNIAPAWLSEMITTGLLGGLGMVLTFLPILAIFYTTLGLLEDTGYLSRAAYLSDRWMHQMGLHGKSFLPILLGFGCNVPAIYGARIIESKRARLLTILLVPFIPCTARMAVVAILTPLFFPNAATWVTWALVGGNLILLAGLGWLLHRFAFKDEHIAFIMELPLYHLPNPKTIGLYVWHNLIGFLEKAGKVILLASLIVWAFSYFPTGEIHTSYLGQIGQWLQPLGQSMGIPWQALIAILTSVAAKENTIATLGILYGDLNSLPNLIPASAGLALLVFQMLFIPCIGTIAAIYQETRSLKWTTFSVLLTLSLSIVAAIFVYQIGSLF